MNLVQTNLLREVAAEVKAQGGPIQFKAHALKNLELRTVLKESHGSPILDIAFNTLGPEHGNLFASIGKDQVTIYDDEHMGDYLGVVVHFVNAPTEHHKGGDVSSCAWVQMAGASRHELGDACLAVAGPEGVIQVISVAEARVVTLLRGHRGGEVVELRGCPGVPGLLASVGADGSVALWDSLAGRCVAEAAQAEALAAELHPNGSCLLTGHRGGRICRWDLTWEQPPAASSSSAAAAAAASTSTSSEHAPPPVRPPLALRGGCMADPAPLSLPAGPSGPALGEHVDCLRCLPGNRLAAKSSDGRLAVWNLGTASAAAAGDGEAVGAAGSSGRAAEAAAAEAAALCLSLRVPGIHAAAGGSARCRMSAARDGAFLCVANPAGDVFVYDTSSGARAAHYSAGKAAGAARAAVGAAAALSEDGRHLLAARGHGYILRYEYIRRPAAASGAAEPSEAGGAEAEAETEAGGAEAGPSSREVSPDCPGMPEAMDVAAAAAQAVAEVEAGGLVGVKRRRETEDASGGAGSAGSGDVCGQGAAGPVSS